MNKLHWFTHDNDALEDEWSQRIIDVFGFAGYGRWWALCELFDRHGIGDYWDTTLYFLRKKLRTQSAECRKFLRFCSKSGKILIEESGQNPAAAQSKAGQKLGNFPEVSRKFPGSFPEVSRKFPEKGQNILRLSIPKMRKRQAKLKFKTPSKLRQNSVKTPQEGEGEGEGEVLLPTGQRDFRIFMDWYLRDCSGLRPGDPDPTAKAAVAAAYRRFGRDCRDVLALAGADPEKAKAGTLAIGHWLESKGLSWNLSTVARWFTDWAQNPGGFNGQNAKR